MKGEITFDTVVPLAGSGNIEGCYRLERESWKVFYFTHSKDRTDWVGEPIITPDAVWESGIWGVNAVYPLSEKLNKSSIMKLMSDILGGVEWTEVLGPDSLTLK